MRQQQDQHNAWLDSTFERRCSWERWIIGWDAAMGHDKFGYFKKLLQAPLKQESVKHALFLIVSSQWCYSETTWHWEYEMKSLKQQKHWAGPLWILKLGKVRLSMAHWPWFNEHRLRETNCPEVCWFTSVLGKWLWMLKAVELDPWQNVFNEALDGHISRGHWHALRRGKAMHFVLYTVFFYVIFPSVCVS